NVLSRGQGRMSQVQDSGARLRFAMALAEAAMHVGDGPRALGALEELGQPDDDPEGLRRYLVLSCRVHCVQRQYLSAMKAFHRAVTGCDFDATLGVLATLQEDLRKLGGFEAARTAVQHCAETEDDNLKLRALDSLQTATLEGARATQLEAEKASGQEAKEARALQRRWRALQASWAAFQADRARDGCLPAVKLRLLACAPQRVAQALAWCACILTITTTIIIITRITTSQQ
ncbi:unnamed protein product, partial [Polarella glacialis]